MNNINAKIHLKILGNFQHPTPNTFDLFLNDIRYISGMNCKDVAFHKTFYFQWFENINDTNVQ